MNHGKAGAVDTVPRSSMMIQARDEESFKEGPVIAVPRIAWHNPHNLKE